MFLEPFGIVIHRGPVTLRLGRAVADAAEAFVHDDPERCKYKPLKQLERAHNLRLEFDPMQALRPGRSRTPASAACT